jgi:hypothetical protein
MKKAYIILIISYNTKEEILQKIEGQQVKDSRKSNLRLLRPLPFKGYSAPIDTPSMFHYFYMSFYNNVDMKKVMQYSNCMLWTLDEYTEAQLHSHSMLKEKYKEHILGKNVFRVIKKKSINKTIIEEVTNFPISKVIRQNDGSIKLKQLEQEYDDSKLDLFINRISATLMRSCKVKDTIQIEKKLPSASNNQQLYILLIFMILFCLLLVKSH